MNKEKRIQILQRLREHNPNPQTELNWNSPFELLIAVLLSAQATDVSVNKATDKLFQVANTPQSILDLGVDGLKEYIKTIGLFNSKAEIPSKPARFCWKNTAVKCRKTEQHSKPYRALGAKRLMWCSILRLAGQRLPLIHTFFVYLTAPSLPSVKMWMK